MSSELPIAAGERPAALQPAENALCRAIDSIDLSLQSVAKDIGRSKGLLESSFGQIAARFAQVHSIAVSGEERPGDSAAETLTALRGVVDALTVELQFEDLLNQLFMHALSRIESICVALNQTRAMAAGPISAGEPCHEHALAVLARTLESLRSAEPGAMTGIRDGRSGSIDLF